MQLYHNFTELEGESHNSVILQSVYYLSVVLENSQCTTDLLNFVCSVVELEINNTCNTDNDLAERCFEVRDDKCSVEWRIAEVFLNISLPDCESFNENVDFVTSRAPALDCPDNFGMYCGSLCQPLCAEFSLSFFNAATTTANKAIHIILYFISIIGGVITLIACYFHREKM